MVCTCDRNCCSCAKWRLVGCVVGIRQGNPYQLKNGIIGGDAGSGVNGAPTNVDPIGRHNGDITLVLCLVFLLFCFERRAQVTFFCVMRILSVVVSCRLNLWNWLPHLHELKISELSFRMVLLLVLKQWRFSIRLTMQILQCRVLEDFIH